ncbi:tetratricopeptide repeat protein [Pelagerythrobacter rhizovicinus]|uniref:Sel1 repeat family protein n=1 Tax=Pelagerythrobacter rhizovicinus TaxID=2268576 RepID=A0A4Q2KKX0_9SPHN|nr:tetratricopeptide repeat protein [Pelagerythrobacter rhizovicinus]RXZ65954.1 sel1 repeat family protein [Pelagerythrobacter rhizovicinus]
MAKQASNPREISWALVAGAILACTPASAERNPISALESLAEKGDPKAQYHLGMMYLTGTSVEQDQERAVEYFKMAAELGDPLASYKLGCFYDGQYDLFDANHDLALQYKLIAAEAGYALAQQDVAGLYYRRDDFESALVWLERAVAQGTAGALSTYASIHNGAPGIAKNPVKTAAYFRLFLQRAGGSDVQRKWLADFERKMTDAQREQAFAIVKGYQPEPSSLTIEALAGARAAETLIEDSL